jgi:hypothetical protein
VHAVYCVSHALLGYICLSLSHSILVSAFCGFTSLVLIRGKQVKDYKGTRCIIDYVCYVWRDVWRYRNVVIVGMM